MFNPYEKLNIEVYGESHSQKIGVLLKGLPNGETVDENLIQAFVDRRKSGLNAWSTPRREEDKLIVKSGLNGNVLNGETFEAYIENKTVHSADYSDIKYIPRPSHADYVCSVKDKTGECPSGGGRFSGRLTAPLCIAGGIAKQLLEKRGIKVLSYIRSIGTVIGDNYASSTVNEQKIENIATSLKALSRAEEMENEVLSAKSRGDSVGGVVDVVVFGMPIGVGDNLFSGLESKISASVFGVPAVKGIEFGNGFKIASSFGSLANDPFEMKNGKIVTSTNNSGGINGGISNGMEITLSVAIRPTPSISLPQKSVNLQTGENVEFSIHGRHDACIVPRGAVCLEAVVSIAILDSVLAFEEENK